MKCLICASHIEKPLSFSTLFLPPQQTPFCETCQRQLQPLEGKRCPYCSALSDQVCSDCRDWERVHPELDTLDSNYAIYAYTPFIQKIFTQWKYRGDYELGLIFKPIVQHTFRTILNIDDSVIVTPIPLSPTRLHERAFNQSEVIAQWISPQAPTLLTRQNHEKQAKKTKYERMTAKNPFNLSKRINKPVLLVDDIYTTGTTLRHASTILKERGCPRVDAFTLIRS